VYVLAEVWLGAFWKCATNYRLRMHMYNRRQYKRARES
jgi:hypothetical protein